VHQDQLDKIKELEEEQEFKDERIRDLERMLQETHGCRCTLMEQLMTIRHALDDLTLGAAEETLDLYAEAEWPRLQRVSYSRRRRLHGWIMEAESAMRRDSGYVSSPPGLED